jgi:hypothetical protein
VSHCDCRTCPIKTRVPLVNVKLDTVSVYWPWSALSRKVHVGRRESFDLNCKGMLESQICSAWLPGLEPVATCASPLRVWILWFIATNSHKLRIVNSALKCKLIHCAVHMASRDKHSGMSSYRQTNGLVGDKLGNRSHWAPDWKNMKHYFRLTMSHYCLPV